MSMPARLAPTQSEFQSELSDILGIADAEALCVAFAGREFYVPDTMVLGEHHPLVVAIGLPAAKLLTYYYHGAKLNFPVAAIRRQRVLDLKAQGMQNSAIAAQLLCTDRYVRKVLALARDAEAETAQPRLFG